MRAPNRSFTARQAAFIAAYTGSILEAALAAGYGRGKNRASAATAGSNLMRRPEVRAAIRAKDEERKAAKVAEVKDRIATRGERQAFWSRVMDDETYPIDARLRASEILGKSCLDFVERHEYSGLTINVLSPYDAAAALAGGAVHSATLAGSTIVDAQLPAHVGQGAQASGAPGAALGPAADARGAPAASSDERGTLGVGAEIGAAARGGESPGSETR